MVVCGGVITNKNQRVILNLLKSRKRLSLYRFSLPVVYYAFCWIYFFLFINVEHTVFLYFYYLYVIFLTFFLYNFYTIFISFHSHNFISTSI